MDTNTAKREMITRAIAEGRATYLPAGARDNATALILVDGVVAAQGSLMETYPDPAATSTFQEVRLVTRDEYFRALNP
jgi:hypothetical protein